MEKIHEKSPCCHTPARRFGARRRQCVVCKKTWRIWKHRRGRKRQRLNMQLLLQYFKGTLKNTHSQKRTVSARLRVLLKKFNQENPWPEIPEGPVIAIADGLIEYFEGRKYTIYFILIRSMRGSQAFILPPYIREGGEVALGWHEAFLQVPGEVVDRIHALVCDGHGGLIYSAAAHGWLLQRCHFHLLARIAHYASYGLANKTGDIGTKIKKLVQIVLYRKDSTEIALALQILQEIKKNITSRSFKTVISGFIKHHEEYRTYLQYPKYFLPATSNSAESLNAQIRDLQYRARGFRTPQSLFAWITGYCKFKKSVTCRGKNQPN